MKIGKFIQKIALILIISVSVSCKKEIPANYANYVGFWQSATSSLEINQNGSGEYLSYSNGSSFEIRGRVKMSSTQVTIKAGIIKKRLSIDKAPFKEDAGAEYGQVTGLMLDKVMLDNEVFIKRN